MRPRDRDRRDGEPLPPDVTADLNAIEAALRGDEEAVDESDLAWIAAELSADRAEPEQDYARALDAWAAAGFPRGGRPGLRSGERDGRRSALRERMGGGIRSWAPLAGAAAALVVVVVSAVELAGGPGDGGEQAVVQDAPAPTEGALETLEDAAAPEAGPASSGADASANLEPGASLSLAAPAAEVPSLAGRAARVAENAGGFVRSSRASEATGSVRAFLRLQVPADELDGVISDLSDLAGVRSLRRTDTTKDRSRDRGDRAGFAIIGLTIGPERAREGG